MPTDYKAAYKGL